MKLPIKKIVCAATALPLAFAAAPAYAQNATDAEVDIVPAASIQKLSDLQFGTIIAGTSASTVVINEDTGVRTVNGTAVAYGGPVSAAKFSAAQRPLLIYVISLPNAIQISNGSEEMTVDRFRLDIPAVRLLPLFAPTLREFNVGGRLNVGPNQEPGNYSGTFTVTVNYL